MSDETEFPGLRRRELGDGVSWRFYKHWGQGYLAGEGVTSFHGDRSGCLRIVDGLPMTNAPSVVQARVYESARGKISAVYSYPNGLGVEPEYFWEIYSRELVPDCERFGTEEAMERRVLELLGDAAREGGEG